MTYETWEEGDTTSSSNLAYPSMWSLGRPPCPFVVLGAELEVAHDDGDLSTGDEQDEQDNEKEAKDVIVLRRLTCRTSVTLGQTTMNHSSRRCTIDFLNQRAIVEITTSTHAHKTKTSLMKPYG